MLFLIRIFFGALLTAVMAIYDGWVLTLLWRWFVVPTFHWMPLTLVSAIGLSLIISFLTYQVSAINVKEDEDPMETLGHLVAYGVAMTTTVLGLGWIVSFFM